MALHFPDGSVIGFATALAAAVDFSAITNDTNPVITHATGTFAVDDVMIMQSGWPNLKNRVMLANAATSTGTTELKGIDTTDTKLFPAGKGAGGVIVASSFVDFSQQGELTSGGGEAKLYTNTWLEDQLGQEFSVPVGTTARTYSLPLDFDSKLPWYEAAKTITRKRTPTVIRIALPDGDVIYEYGYVFFNAAMNMQSANPIKNKVSFHLFGSEGTLIDAAA